MNLKVFKVSGRLKAAFSTYPIQLVLCFALCTVLSAYAVWYYHSGLSRYYVFDPGPGELTVMRVFSAISMGLAAALAAALTMSRLRPDLSRERKLLPGIAVCALSAAGAFLSMLLDDPWLSWAIVLALICVYFHLAEGKTDKALHLRAFCSELLISACITGVFILGMMLISVAVDSLFDLPGRATGIMLSLSALIPALTLAPVLFLGGLALNENKETPSSDARFSPLLWVGFSLYLLLNAVLLVYIVSIILSGKMPSGILHPLALVLLGGYALLRLLLSGSENTLSRLFIRYAAWTAFPVALMQAYAIIVRVNAYGFTPLRILGIGCALAVWYALICGLMRRRAPGFFLLIAALCVALLWQPLNAVDLSRLNQESRLKRALIHADMLDQNTLEIIPRADPDEADKEIILSAYGYLTDVNDYPAGSFTAVLRQQSDYEDENSRQLKKSAQELFGFEKDSSVSYYVTLSGSWHVDYADSLDGFDRVEKVDAYSKRENADEPDERVYLVVNGREFALADLVQLTENGDFSLTNDTVVFDNGDELRIAEIYYDRRGTYAHLRGWLMRVRPAKTPQNE